MTSQEDTRRRAVESEASDFARGVRAGRFTLAEARDVIGVPEATAALLTEFFTTLEPQDQQTEYLTRLNGVRGLLKIPIYPCRPDDLTFRQEVSVEFERLMAAGS